MRLTPHVLGLLAGTVISTALGGCGGAVIDAGSTTTVAASRESDPTSSTTSTTTTSSVSTANANANGTETETTDGSASGDESAVLTSQPGVGIGPEMDYAVACGRG
jgi:hypothetical protein